MSSAVIDYAKAWRSWRSSTMQGRGAAGSPSFRLAETKLCDDCLGQCVRARSSLLLRTHVHVMMCVKRSHAFDGNKTLSADTIPITVRPRIRVLPTPSEHRSHSIHGLRQFGPPRGAVGTRKRKGAQAASQPHTCSSFWQMACQSHTFQSLVQGASLSQSLRACLPYIQKVFVPHMK